MAVANVNGVRLFYEVSGAGEVPLVLVHGSWGSHHNWDLVVPELAESFRVLTYDRRGHSESERPPEQGSVREDVADLAALIEHLELGPAWVAGNSFGASITLRLAGERPDLLRGIIAHEPPLFSLLANDPSVAPMLDEVGKRIGAVVERIASGDDAGAAEQFVETVALGPGSLGISSRPISSRRSSRMHRRSWTRPTIRSSLPLTSHGSGRFIVRRSLQRGTRAPRHSPRWLRRSPTCCPTRRSLRSQALATFHMSPTLTHMSKRSWLSSARTRPDGPTVERALDVDVGPHDVSSTPESAWVSHRSCCSAQRGGQREFSRCSRVTCVFQSRKGA